MENVIAITKIEKFDFNAEEDPLLGFPTVNVGTIQGGVNINSVPDYATFTIDIRSTTKVNHKDLLICLQEELGSEIFIKTLVDLPPVFSDKKNPFVQIVYSVCDISPGTSGFPRSLPYLTDGAVLQQVYNGAPTIILGPGQPERAHQTDEFYYTSKLLQAVETY